MHRFKINYNACVILLGSKESRHSIIDTIYVTNRIAPTVDVTTTINQELQRQHSLEERHYETSKSRFNESIHV